MKYRIILLTFLLLLNQHIYSEQFGHSQTRITQSKEKKSRPELLQSTIPSEFVRFIKKPHQQCMQTAIIRYENRDGITVDLIAAIHIGDKSYYDKLNTIFNDYDAMLFEMITDNSQFVKKIKKTDDTFNVTSIQNILKTMLGLEHQAELIDYTKKNFVHADMSMKLLIELQKKNNTSIYSMMAKASKAYEKQLYKTNGQTGQLTVLDLLVFLMSEDSKREMKLWLAPQLATMLHVISGKEKGIAPLIIIKRNQVALKILLQQIAQGKKKLAIFYGAAHMPHFEQQLLYSLGFNKIKITWITAWDLAGKNNNE